MANISAILSITTEDADGEVFSAPIYGVTDDGNTLADVFTLVGSIISDYQLISDGAITKARLSLNVPLPVGVPAPITAGAEIERTALFNFRVEDQDYSFSLDVPAFKYDKYITGTNQVNLSDTDVSNFVAQVTAISSVFQAVDPVSQNPLEGVRTAVKTFRKHRRQTKRT